MSILNSGNRCGRILVFIPSNKVLPILTASFNVITSSIVKFSGLSLSLVPPLRYQVIPYDIALNLPYKIVFSALILVCHQFYFRPLPYLTNHRNCILHELLFLRLSDSPFLAMFYFQVD